jgi:hypothetical protein
MRAVILAAGIAAFAASGALANGNDVHVQQAGSHNQTHVQQVGSGNTAQIRQNGSDNWVGNKTTAKGEFLQYAISTGKNNDVKIDQNGQSNRVAYRQWGVGNKIDGKQNGQDNAAIVVQGAPNQMQWGNNKATFDQNGSGNQAYISQKTF